MDQPLHAGDSPVVILMYPNLLRPTDKSKSLFFFNYSPHLTLQDTFIQTYLSGCFSTNKYDYQCNENKEEHDCRYHQCSIFPAWPVNIRSTDRNYYGPGPKTGREPAYLSLNILSEKDSDF